MDIFSALGPSPEEIEQNRMRGEILQMRVDNFIDGLSPEDLSTFSMIVARMAAEGEEKIYHGQVLGTIGTLFRLNYPTVCKGCGTEHSMDQPHDGMPDSAPEKDDSPEEAEPEPKSDPKAAYDPKDIQYAAPETLPYHQPTLFEAVDADKPGTLAENIRANMEAYSLKESDQFGGNGFECTKCGLYYTSLEDRMLRDEDKCHGCIEKAKWG